MEQKKSNRSSSSSFSSSFSSSSSSSSSQKTRKTHVPPQHECEQALQLLFNRAVTNTSMRMLLHTTCQQEKCQAQIQNALFENKNWLGLEDVVQPSLLVRLYQKYSGIVNSSVLVLLLKRIVEHYTERVQQSKHEMEKLHLNVCLLEASAFLGQQQQQQQFSTLCLPKVYNYISTFLRFVDGDPNVPHPLQAFLKNSMTCVEKKEDVWSRAISLLSQSRSIVVVCGAGISVNAGIPDFRSMKNGFYDRVPSDVFTSLFFNKKPEEFYRLCQPLFHSMTKAQPTPTHRFIARLQRENRLSGCWTQNIDGLEIAATCPRTSVFPVHGSFSTGYCLSETCKAFQQQVPLDGSKPLCDQCGNYRRPSIVFFDEKVHHMELFQTALQTADLLLVIGTSLLVDPIATYVKSVIEACKTPILMINKEQVYSLPFYHNKYLFLQSDCDSAVDVLQQALSFSFSSFSSSFSSSSSF
jgi:NAD-dependent SIR2 family protein deacetylase